MSTNVYKGQVGGELLVDVDKKAISTSDIDKGSGHIMYTTKLCSCKKVSRLCRMMAFFVILKISNGEKCKGGIKSMKNGTVLFSFPS